MKDFFLVLILILCLSGPTAISAYAQATSALKLSAQGSQRIKDIQAAIRQREGEIQQLQLALQNEVLGEALDLKLDRKALSGLQLKEVGGEFVLAPKDVK